MRVIIKNARDADLATAYPVSLDYELDQVMLALWKGETSNVSAAMSLVAKVIAQSPLHQVIKQPNLARVIYPFQRLVRSVALAVKRVPDFGARTN